VECKYNSYFSNPARKQGVGLLLDEKLYVAQFPRSKNSGAASPRFDLFKFLRSNLSTPFFV
jgi:hypothetical protein